MGGQLILRIHLQVQGSFQHHSNDFDQRCQDVHNDLPLVSPHLIRVVSKASEQCSVILDEAPGLVMGIIAVSGEGTSVRSSLSCLHEHHIHVKPVA